MVWLDYPNRAISLGMVAARKLGPHPLLRYPMRSARRVLLWLRAIANRIADRIPRGWLRSRLENVGRGPISTFLHALTEAQASELRRRRHVNRAMSRIREIEAEVQSHEPGPNGAPPIVLFSTTSAPGWISFTSMIGLLAAWSLRLSGQKVVSWVCNEGMTRCPQGTFPRAPGASPPCGACWQIRHDMFAPSARESFSLDPSIRQRLSLPGGMTSIAELAAVRYRDIDIGRLCLPSLRHTLKRHNLADDRTTTGIYADFIISAANIVDAFSGFLSRVRPRTVVVFNGLTFPEAVAREVALRSGVPVVTYEVGFRRHSTAFSHGLAPEHAIEVPSSFNLSAHEEQELDRLLEQRFRGDFTMGGVKFWPEMTGLSDELLAKASEFEQMVSIFTNTVYDTSQVSANTIFPSMFDWLEETLKLAGAWPNTLFVVRAHPDEYRRGQQKSMELVGDWFDNKGLPSMENVVFIPPTRYISSYELVKASKLCAVYNSTIGLEAAMLGVPVICGGLTKYNSASFVHSFDNASGYLSQFSAMLGETAAIPQEWQSEARRFFYYLFFKSSLDLSRYVEWDEAGQSLGFNRFRPDELLPDKSEEMRIIHNGVVNGSSFCYT